MEFGKRCNSVILCSAMTVSGETLGTMLDWWEQSERRATIRKVLKERDGIDPSDVIMGPDAARAVRRA